MIRRTLALLPLLLVPVASAHAVPIASGTATVGGKTLKISRGQIEDGEGVVRLSGTLAAGGETLKTPQIDLRAGGVVTAKVDGLRQPVFSVLNGKARVGTNPTRIRVSGVKLRPTGALRGGGRLALTIRAKPRHVLLAGGQTTLALDEAFRADLQAELVRPGANEGAVIDDSGRAQFPIAGGRLLLGRKGGGNVDHGGGLSFSKENFVELRLNDFKIGLGRPGVLRARVNDSEQRLVIATVPFGAPTFGPSSALVADTLASLTSDGASTLNTELGTDRFGAGDPFGALAVDAVVR